MAARQGRWAFVARGLTWGGWLVLAVVVGSLVTALTSEGGPVLVLAAGATLTGALLGPRLADRWPVLRGPTTWAALVLAGLAVLVTSVRNTPLGLAPVRWISVVLAAAALVVAVAGLRRGRGVRSWVVLAVVATALVGVGVDGFGPHTREAVRVSNGAVELSGTLFRPRGVGPFPLVVFVHGADAERGLVSHHMADRLARDGIAALAWDKRGTGASRGGSPRDSFDELASDIEAWVRAMRDRDDVAEDRVAVWGWSEGAWTGPLAASRVGEVAALVLVSPAVRVEDAVIFEKGWAMRAAGVAEEEIARAADLRRRINQHYRTGEGRSVLLAEVADVRAEPWYQAALDAGLLPDRGGVYKPGSPEAESWLDYMDFSTLEQLRGYGGPVLVAVGLDDRCTPAAAAADEIEQALQEAGNLHRVLSYHDASHVILQWLANPETCDGFGIPPLWYPRGYVDDVATWLQAALLPGRGR